MSNDKHLLIGNGFSIALHGKFEYQWLFENADLSPIERKLFGQSHDFEKVLCDLKIASEVIKSIEIASESAEHKNNLITMIEKHREEIRKKLIETIKDVHPLNLEAILEGKKLQEYIKILKEFKSFYSINYDLILYWLMREGSNYHGQKWKDGFDKTNGTLHWPSINTSNYYYLHGALHFLISSVQHYELEKLKNNKNKRILTQVNEPFFVCEGASDTKLDHIYHSAYLYESLKSLSCISGELFLYGVSLSESDRHIWETINKNETIDRLYISYFNNGKINKEKFKNKANGFFPRLRDAGKLNLFETDCFEGLFDDINKRSF